MNYKIEIPQSDADYSQIEKFFAKIWAEEFEIFLEKQIEKYQSSIIFFARENNEIISAVTAHFSKNQWKIGRFATEKNHRGKWIGTKIFAKILQYFEEKNIPEIFIRAEITKVDFYKKFGFEICGEAEKTGNTEAILMKKIFKNIKINTMKKLEQKIIIDNSFWIVFQTFWKHANGKIGNVLTMKKSQWKSGDAVFVLPITKEWKILAIEEFKFWPEEKQICIPAGTTDGEDLLKSAKRELLEETGYTSDNFIYIGKQNQWNYIQGSMHLFIALECEQEQSQQLQDIEDISVLEFDIQDFERLIDENIIKCPWTINCFYYYFSKIFKKY